MAVLDREGIKQGYYPTADFGISLHIFDISSTECENEVNFGIFWGSGELTITQTDEIKKVAQDTIPYLPVATKGNKVIFDSNQMEVNKPYKYTLNKKEYVAVKDVGGSIDIYRIHNR
jgi:hypothetical protein